MPKDEVIDVGNDFEAVSSTNPKKMPSKELLVGMVFGQPVYINPETMKQLKEEIPDEKERQKLLSATVSALASNPSVVNYGRKMKRR